jgi:radical SAM-linked protein
MRFLSHADTLRLWQRALTRAAVPVRFSQGFNPHMQMTLPLPRSVGMTSEAELVIVTLTHPCDIDETVAHLKKQLVPGIDIYAARHLDEDISAVPEWASYRIVLDETSDRKMVEAKIKDFNASSSLAVKRQAHGRHKSRRIDIRPGINSLELDGNTILCTIKIEPRATVRISELMNILSIDNPLMAELIERTAVGFPTPFMFNNN